MINTKLNYFNLISFLSSLKYRLTKSIQTVIRGTNSQGIIRTYPFDSISKEKPPEIEIDTTNYPEILGDKFDEWLFAAMTKGMIWGIGFKENISPEERNQRNRFVFWAKQQKTLGNIQKVGECYFYSPTTINF